MKHRLAWISRRSLPLVAFGAGILLGTSFRDGSPGPKDPASDAASPTKTGATSSAIEPGVESETPSVSLPPEPVATRPEYIDRLHGLVELNQNLRRKIRVPMFGVEELSDDFVRLYALQPAEAARLREAIAAAREKLNELRARNARIEKTGDEEFRIVVPEAPVEGGMIHDELIQTIHETLGPQRLAFYETLSAVDFEQSSYFERFGLNRSEIRVKPMRNEAGKPIQQVLMSNLQEEVMLLTTEIDPELFRERFPLLHRKIIEGDFTPAPP